MGGRGGREGRSSGGTCRRVGTSTRVARAREEEKEEEEEEGVMKGEGGREGGRGRHIYYCMLAIFLHPFTRLLFLIPRIPSP